MIPASLILFVPLDLFLNVEEHVEIRLQSYLIFIECANSTLLNRVLHQLHDEPVRQGMYHLYDL